MSGWVAAAATAAGLYALLRKRGLRSLRNQDSTTAYFVMFLFVFLFLTAFTWLMLGRSLPDVITRLVGTPREFTASLRKDWKDSKSGTCEQFIKGDLFNDRFPSRYCPDDQAFARLPETGPMRVVVRESWFGMHIERIEPVATPK